MAVGCAARDETGIRWSPSPEYRWSVSMGECCSVPTSFASYRDQDGDGNRPQMVLHGYGVPALRRTYVGRSVIGRSSRLWRGSGELTLDQLWRGLLSDETRGTERCSSAISELLFEPTSGWFTVKRGS